MNRAVLISLMIFAMVAWGETWISAKILNRYLSSNELIFWRFFFTTLGMIIVLWFFKISLKESSKELALSFFAALFLSLYNSFFFLGTKHGLASFGGIFVTTLNPIITFALVAMLAKKALQTKEILGLFIGVVGALFMLKIWQLDTKELFSLGNI
jgi:drug/metabolite transporter (DMT)-like permease